MMFALCPIPLTGGPFQAIKNWLGSIAYSSSNLSLFPTALAGIGLVDLRYDDYVQAMGRAGAGPGFALRPVLSNVVASRTSSLVPRKASATSPVGSKSI